MGQVAGEKVLEGKLGKLANFKSKEFDDNTGKRNTVDLDEH
jgi:hypothetical protein